MIDLMDKLEKKIKAGEIKNDQDVLKIMLAPTKNEVI